MSILYASYNTVLLIPVLISIRNYISNKKELKWISYAIILIISILILIVYSFLMNIKVNIKELEMPAVYAINKIHPRIKSIYGVINLISIFTTAISLGISFLNNVTENKKRYNKMAIFICLTSIIFSKIGFSNLVNLFYPILGILGLIQIMQIMK